MESVESLLTVTNCDRVLACPLLHSRKLVKEGAARKFNTEPWFSHLDIPPRIMSTMWRKTLLQNLQSESCRCCFLRHVMGWISFQVSNLLLQLLPEGKKQDCSAPRNQMMLKLFWHIWQIPGHTWTLNCRQILFWLFSSACHNLSSKLKGISRLHLFAAGSVGSGSSRGSGEAE